MSDKGHFRLPNSVVDDHLARLGPGPTMLLICLGRHADKNHKCFPSIDHLQELTGMARATVIKYMAQLEEWEVIHRTRHGRRMFYTIMPPP